MPTVVETEVEAFAHCVQPRCPGNRQEPVRARRTETGYTYIELGGDMPGMERSHITFTASTDDDLACPHCGNPREVTDQARRSYPPLSGHDPMGLLHAKFDPEVQVEMVREARQSGVDPEKEGLREQNAMLSERLDEMAALIQTLAPAQEKEKGK